MRSWPIVYTRTRTATPSVSLSYGYGARGQLVSVSDRVWVWLGEAKLLSRARRACPIKSVRRRSQRSVLGAEHPVTTAKRSQWHRLQAEISQAMEMMPHLQPFLEPELGGDLFFNESISIKTGIVRRLYKRGVLGSRSL